VKLLNPFSQLLPSSMIFTSSHSTGSPSLPPSS
jgi:hypothetical protein